MHCGRQQSRSASLAHLIPAHCGFNESMLADLPVGCGIFGCNGLFSGSLKHSTFSGPAKPTKKTGCRSRLEHFPAVGSKNIRSRLEIGPQQVGKPGPQPNGRTSAVGWKFVRSGLEKCSGYRVQFKRFSGFHSSLSCFTGFVS